MTVAVLLEKVKEKTWANCVHCGKRTTWWFKREKVPLCLKCKHSTNTKQYQARS